MKNYYYKIEFPKVKKKIEELRKEFRSEWIKEMEDDYNKNEMENLIKIIRAKRRIGFDVSKEESKYKYLYNKVFNDKKDNKIDLESKKNVPIQTINPEQMTTSSNGKLVGLCPFHKEKTPSFYVFEDNSFHCFGCGAHGYNAIDFIIKLKNCSFKEAIEQL